MLSPADLLIWSMTLGAMLAVAVARAVHAAFHPARPHVAGVAFHLGVSLSLFLLCGLPETLLPAERLGWLPVAQVLIGPASIAAACHGLALWLTTYHRDRLSAAVLRGVSIALPLLGLACLLLPPALRLPASFALGLLSLVAVQWICVRAWLLGDPLAGPMAVGCALSLVAVAGLYASVLQLPMAGTVTHVVSGLCAAIGNGLVGYLLWERTRIHLGAEAGAQPARHRRDPVTHLHTGQALVQRLLKARGRRRMTGREGAVLAVMLFDLDRLQPQLGHAGINELLLQAGQRLQRHVGVVNPVGRYWDRCFIAFVESIHSVPRLRSLGQRVAARLCDPFEVTGAHGEGLLVHAEVGVGVVLLPAGSTPIEEVLHDAQQVAVEARGMRARAAMRDADSGAVVALEPPRPAARRPGAGPR